MGQNELCQKSSGTAFSDCELHLPAIFPVSLLSNMVALFLAFRVTVPRPTFGHPPQAVHDPMMETESIHHTYIESILSYMILRTKISPTFHP